MKSKATILNNIEKELKLNKEDSLHFFNCVKGYIKAVKENRLICNIEHVSKSGLSRYLTFNYLEKSKYNKKRYNLLGTHFIFKSLGFRYNKNHEAFYISGCGMDMVFHTNYCNIHDFYRLGFITKKECEKLAQCTPPVV